jgi:hypothetical protein
MTNPPLIDAHCHWFSNPFFQALAEESPMAGTVHQRMALVQESTGLQMPDEDDSVHRRNWLAEMEESSVDRLVIFSSHPKESGTVAEAAAAAPKQLTGVAVINPTAENAAQKARTLLVERGMRGLLLFPAQHGFRIDSPLVDPVLEEIAAVQGVCYVHCGLFKVPLRDHFGLKRTANPSLANPLYLVPAADRHPNVNFIIPHFGAGMFRETLMAGMQCRNISTDTSSSNGWIRTQSQSLTLKDVFERALDAFGTKRVLFGTDSGPFPAGWREDRLSEQSSIVRSLGGSADEYGQIFGGNIARLLDLS